MNSELVNSIRLTRESTDSWMTVISPTGLSQDFWDEWVAEKLPGWEVCLANDPEGVDALLPNADAVLDAYMRVGFSRERLEVAGQLSVCVTKLLDLALQLPVQM